MGRSCDLAQLLCQGNDEVMVCDFRKPLFGDASVSVVSSCELPVYSACGVCVFSQVDRQEAALFEVLASVESPESGLERFDNVSASLDLGRIPMFERTASDLFDLG